ncbi:MAG TPA: hypothetical protein VFW96_07450 [Thermomicrobiales bacterium]|nr:hypothetical protein [Thermomicrobiales bacterium]
MSSATGTHRAVSRRIRRVIAAAALALALLAGVGGAAQRAAAMPMTDHVRQCSAIAGNYQLALLAERSAAARGDWDAWAAASARVAYDVAYWNRAGCYGDIDGWYRV